MKKLFTDIIGQEGAVGILSAQLNSGNFSHAYIFLGEEGTGKEYLAREFSKYILCYDLDEKEECKSCLNFNNSVHPDFIYVNGEEGIKIDKVREIIEKINLSPFLSKRKVLLLTKAENLGIEAANALLKTLEEPPADSIIIITAVSEKTLPETIISRTQKIKLVPMPEEYLKKILQKSFSMEEIEKVLNFSEGNIGTAKQLLEDSEKLKDKENIVADINKIFDQNDLIEKFIILDKYEKSKKLPEFFGLFAKKVFKDIRVEITENSNDQKLIELEGMAKKVLKIYEDLDYNVNLRLALEEVILEREKYA